MSDTANSGTATPPPEPAEAKEPTSYMVLYSRVLDQEPERPDLPIAWFEIGWYEAHSANGAAARARDDQESGHYAAMFDAGKRGGVRIRAIAKRSWPDDVDVQEIALRPEWATGEKAGS